jgi:hypothetical protein
VIERGFDWLARLLFVLAALAPLLLAVDCRVSPAMAQEKAPVP